MAFVRSGNVNLVYGQGRVVGEYGYGWSRTNGGKRKETTGATTIVQLPLAFVRSGYVALNNGTTSYAGYYGYNWSSISKASAASAYNLYFGITNAPLTSDSGNRYHGFPLRCL